MCMRMVTSLVAVGVTRGVVFVLMCVCSPVWHGGVFGLWLQGERVEKLSVDRQIPSSVLLHCLKHLCTAYETQ